jgi:hypothetical protein
MHTVQEENGVFSNAQWKRIGGDVTSEVQVLVDV